MIYVPSVRALIASFAAAHLLVASACVGDTVDLDRAPEAPEGLAFRFEGPIESLVFAPGGRWLAVEEQRAPDASRLWLVDVRDRGRALVTEHFAWPLRFSRDGSVLLYVDAADGPRPVLRALDAGSERALSVSPADPDAGLRFATTQRHAFVVGARFGAGPVAAFELDGTPIELDERWGPMELRVDFRGAGAALQTPADRAPFLALFDDEAGAVVETRARQRAERWVEAGLLLSSVPTPADPSGAGLVVRSRDGAQRSIDDTRPGERRLDARTLCVWSRTDFRLRATRFADGRFMETTLADDPLQLRAVGGLCVAQLADALVIVDPARRVVDRVEGRSDVGQVAFLDADDGTVLVLSSPRDGRPHGRCGDEASELRVYDGVVDPPRPGRGPFVAGARRLLLFACAEGRLALHRWSRGQAAPELVSANIPEQPGFVSPDRTRAVFFDRVTAPTVDNPNGFTSARPWRASLDADDPELRRISDRPRRVRELALSDSHLALATADEEGWSLEVLEL